MEASRDIYPIVLKKKKPLQGYKIKKLLVPWIFLLPGITFTLILRYYTMYQGLLLSFFHYDVRNPPGTFIGFKNFSDLFNSTDYWKSWRNTLIFLVLILSMNFFIPIIQALCLEEVIRFRSFASTLYILPAVIPGTVSIVLWKWIWSPDFGAANFVLKLFGADPKLWLSDIYWVKFCIIFPGIIGGGVAVLLYLAAILGISEDVKEASKLDGCTGIKRMYYIILPNITFLIFIQLILTTMGALQILDGPFQFTKGGPAGASLSLPLHIYNLYNGYFDFGKASAAAMTLMLIITIITFIQLKLDKQQSE